jgi:hypothetical protein
MIDGIEKEFFDPRVQMENTGAERIDATRLATANTLRSLDHLPSAVGDDDGVYRATYNVILSTHAGLLNSVARLVGGTERVFDPGDGPRVMRVPPEMQRDAIDYLLGEGIRTLEPFREPEVLERIAVTGGGLAVDRVQASLMSSLITGPKLGLLDSQAQLYPGAYSPVDLGKDVAASVWEELSDGSRTARVIREAWVQTHADLITAWATASQTEPAGIASGVVQGIPQAVMAVLAESGDSTVYRPWLRTMLPELKASIDEAVAGSEGDLQLHLLEMSSEIGRLIAMLG